jgi:hypothetical protein
MVIDGVVSLFGRNIPNQTGKNAPSTLSSETVA